MTDPGAAGAPPPAITDSHCHLDFPGLAEEAPAVLARARAAGVRRVVTICTRPRLAPQVRAIAEADDGVFWAAGLHPLHVAEEPLPTVEELVALAAHPRLVALGETGLDLHYTPDTAARQEESLRVHCEAARRTGLPLVIHARDADRDVARILADEHRAGPFGAVMHCFSSGAALAQAALDLGFFLSASGIAAFPRSEALREIFRAAPRDRIVVETDAPYLAPPPHRGRRNEPAHVVHTARRLAEALEMTYPELARLTESNVERLFARLAAASRPRRASA